MRLVIISHILPQLSLPEEEQNLYLLSALGVVVGVLGLLFDHLARKVVFQENWIKNLGSIQ